MYFPSRECPLCIVLLLLLLLHISSRGPANFSLRLSVSLFPSFESSWSLFSSWVGTICGHFLGHCGKGQRNGRSHQVPAQLPSPLAPPPLVPHHTRAQDPSMVLHIVELAALRNATWYPLAWSPLLPFCKEGGGLTGLD